MESKEISSREFLCLNLNAKSPESDEWRGIEVLCSGDQLRLCNWTLRAATITLTLFDHLKSYRVAA
jgi:hypothetical protein